MAAVCTAWRVVDGNSLCRNINQERSSIAMTTRPVAAGSRSGGAWATFAIPSPSAAAVEEPYFAEATSIFDTFV